MYSQTAQLPGFLSFIVDGHNRKYLRVAVIACVVQFVIFKILYPFPDFFSDSYSFIETAAKGDNFNIWPVGYSKFLSAVRMVTSSDVVVVAIQYVVMVGCSVIFFFTILYFYRPSTFATQILFVFLFVNPLVLYLCNYISSDSLFSALSLLWFAHLLWIVHESTRWHIYSHGILLFVIFTLRYNALYYPLVAMFAFLFSTRPIRQKLVGVLFPTVLIALFVMYTRREAYKMTGTYQFSVLSGWHWANNALYMYPYIEVDDAKISPSCKALHNMTAAYFKAVPDEYRDVSPRRGGFYFKHKDGPLRQYLSSYCQADPDRANDVRGWGAVAPVLSEYGTHLIKEHPVAYARYYLLPNVGNYFFPPLEKMSTYNMGRDRLGTSAREWFEYKSKAARSVSFTLQGSVLSFFPMLFAIINVAFIAGLAWYGWTAAHRRPDSVNLSRGLILTALFFLVSMAFSVVSAPMALRYLVVNMLVLLAFSLLISDLVPWEQGERESPPNTYS